MLVQVVAILYVYLRVKEMSSPFDYVNAITFSKKDMMRGTDNDELAEKSYEPFLTNRALSYHIDCVPYANEMNQYPDLDKLLQFDFFINTLRPMKRFAKWVKAEKVDNLEAVKLSFNYSNEKALQIIDLLSDEQINEIIKDRTGGVEK